MISIKKYIWNAIKNNKILLKITSKLYYLINRNKRRIRGTNNKIYCNGTFLRKTYINISGNNNTVLIGKTTRMIGTYIHIVGNDNIIKIGENAVIGKCDLWREDNSGEIYIGDRSTINSGHIANTEDNGKIKIGKNCMISNDITFRNGDSHSILDIHTGERINYAKDIIIEDNVWVGERAYILKGVRIGEGSVVATAAIVTKSFTRHSIIGGSPAVIKKENIRWIRERVW